MATQHAASTLSARAPARYGSGCGLPWVTSSPVIVAANECSGADIRTASANRRHDIVTSTQGIDASRHAVSSSMAPGRHGNSCCMRSITPSINLSTNATGSISTPAARNAAAVSRRSEPISEAASDSVQVPPNSLTSSCSHSIQYGSVSTSVPSMSHSTAASSAIVGRLDPVSQLSRGRQ